MTQTRPITIRMTEILVAVAQYRMGQKLDLDTRTANMLVRRGLLELRNNRYCCTQQGREALGTKVAAPVGCTSVVACRYWQSFYGFQIELKYHGSTTDRDAWTRLDYPIMVAPEEAVEFITRELEKKRHLILNCCPVLVSSPDVQE